MIDAFIPQCSSDRKMTADIKASTDLSVQEEAPDEEVRPSKSVITRSEIAIDCAALLAAVCRTAHHSRCPGCPRTASAIGASTSQPVALLRTTPTRRSRATY
ncbi:hypothetical protein SPRG_20064 [Saprolegnia parasitica CBS 223.65]|uniref:Uncharacterized protein n=1 Tax=Saprolegnia parasitica (strain CBS 223.65) TaxID=695850 RepID=A0A067CQ62_SAPPC|nr:hypothetical protein SPRG_20064 [Saprolegnia parasitica CBS 223.65]KDO28957.1 hypothetical protein SPRG_20064 [Saprolegnia parasitica CBS 223.65]|eukprot:XP_012200297.1 hypothetical protein SPRG_20064 [Saprolegnia parasitica CBS 223.65]